MQLENESRLQLLELVSSKTERIKIFAQRMRVIRCGRLSARGTVPGSEDSK